MTKREEFTQRWLLALKTGRKAMAAIIDALAKEYGIENYLPAD